MGSLRAVAAQLAQLAPLRNLACAAELHAASLACAGARGAGHARAQLCRALSAPGAPIARLAGGGSRRAQHTYAGAQRGLASAAQAEEVEEAEAEEGEAGSPARGGAAIDDGWPPQPGIAPPFAPSEDGQLATEGEVWFAADGPLASSIVRHWSVMPADYRERVSFDEFGERFLRQMEKEEKARQRALQRLRELEAAPAAAGAAGASSAGTSGRPDAVQARLGGITKRLVHTWLPLLEDAIQQEQKEILESSRDTKKDRVNYGPYLLLLSPQDLALLTIQSVLSHTASSVRRSSDADALHRDASSAPAVQVADAIGRAVHDFVAMLRYKSRERQQARSERERQQGAFGDLGDVAAEFGAGPVLGPRTTEQLLRRQALVEQGGAKYDSGMQRVQTYAAKPDLKARSRTAAAAVLAGDKWDIEARIKVGAVLLALLVENSPVPDSAAGGKGRSGALATQPAFEYAYRRVGVKNQAFVSASAALCALIGHDESLKASMLAKHPPMLVPPMPWRSHREGGYLTMRHWMMRTRWSALIKEQLEGTAAAMAGGARGYREAVDALNVLGSTAWRINTPVLATMDALWSAKKAVAGLPSQDELRTPPPPPTTYRLVTDRGALHARAGPLTAAERRDHRLACDDVRKRRRNAASLRADFQLKFGVAHEYAQEPEFYYPHTVDFRGRAYPMHPNLQHLGDDMCRGLLTFAHGRPLGPYGLDWLYVHLANVWGRGVDKLSFDARRQFARDQLADVLACAEQPLERDLWQRAEKPWQFLAACIEIKGALASLDPAAYLSRLPVHMDGSCNGLQHYAALGRDEAGGRAVNLTPSDVPQDVYAGVADIVARRVERDARARPQVDALGRPLLDPATGAQIVLPARSEALRVVNLVDRKLVKQTVMTSVYGVTPIGARAQIEARLRDKGWSDADRDTLWAASKYLADATIDAIGEMFANAKHIMKWLADCAHLVAHTGEGVRWTNPVGLPIYQPYHNVRPVGVATVAQRFSVQREDADRGAPVTKMRQRSAFPPNYIHSIDSAHMMRTAVACSDKGMTFAGVHDSFWTHAGSVGDMNRVLREEFVRLHTEGNLLEELRAQLTAQCPGVAFPPVPTRGRLNVAKVKSSRYFFS